MGLLAGFAAGAAQGVQSHWADVREKVAADAKRAFEERLVQVRADAQVNAAKQMQENAFDFEQETLPKRLDMAEQTAIRTAETENSLADRFAPDTNRREAEALRSRLSVEQEFATGPEWQNLIDANGNVVGQQNSKTGKIQYFPGYRAGGGSDGGSGGGSGSSFKVNLKNFDVGNGIEYPNVWVDTKTGAIIDLHGELSKPSVALSTIQTEVDQEIEQRKSKAMSILDKASKALGGKGLSEEEEKEVFGGMTEDQFRQAETQRLLSEAPTVADKLEIDRGRLVRSEEELAARYQQMGIPVPGGMMSQYDAQSGQQGSNVYIPPDMFTEESGGTDFESRINNASSSPVIQNADGTVSTHRMASAEVDGKHIAYPTIVRQPDGSLKELSDDEAIEHAMRTGEFKEFKTEKEAQQYAEGGYKEGSDLGKETPTRRSLITDEEQALLDEMNISLGEFEKRIPSPYANSDVTGTISRFIDEYGPATNPLSQLATRSAKAYGGLITDVGESVVESHKRLVALGDRAKANDRARLAKSFFDGNASVSSARAVIESGLYPEGSRERRAAEIYLKAKGQM